MNNSHIDLTPDPRILKMLGEIPLKGWQCVAELIDNSIDGFINNNKKNTIIVTIPSPSELKNNLPLIIEDNGIGMKFEDFNKALKAGYSGKASDDNLGLFGMGFNISTAKLGNKTVVWTSTKDDNKDIGVEIDFFKMQRERTFITELKTRPNSKTSSKGKSGTTIEVSNYTGSGSQLLKSREDIKRKLNFAYSKKLFESKKLELNVNGDRINGKIHCIWDHSKSSRYATYKNEKFPPYVEILPTKLRTVPYCNYCLSELSFLSDDILPVVCDYCGEEGNISKKDYVISGWIGIQRFFDPNDYGVDIIRNGRIIEPNVKEIFKWIPRDSYTIDEDKLEKLNKFNGVLPEYPIDNKGIGGRIVGEIYADFIKPRYTKDSFDRTELWYDAMEIIRGDSPLQKDWASKYMGMPLNTSPLSRLYHAYRRTEPGQANLVCGSPTGDTANPGNILSLQYYDKYIAGDPDFQDDEKWFELVMLAEGKVDEDDIDEIEDGYGEDSGEGTSTTDGRPSPEDDPYYGVKEELSVLEIDLSSDIDISKKNVTIYKWTPQRLVFRPIIFINVSSKEWHFLINQHHNMVKDFTEGWEDVFLMEIAHRFAVLVSEKDKWTITSIYYTLKNKYFKERLLNKDKLVTSAGELVDDILEYLIRTPQTFERKPTLTEKEIEMLRRNYVAIENKEIKKTSILTKDTEFLRYMDKPYIFKFIADFPQFIFDGKFFDLPYLTITDIELRESRLNIYKSNLSNVSWILSTLSDITSQTLLSNKNNIIKAKLSLEELNSKRV